MCWGKENTENVHINAIESINNFLPFSLCVCCIVFLVFFASILMELSLRSKWFQILIGDINFINESNVLDRQSVQSPIVWNIFRTYHSWYNLMAFEYHPSDPCFQYVEYVSETVPKCVHLVNIKFKLKKLMFHSKYSRFGAYIRRTAIADAEESMIKQSSLRISKATT